MEGDSVSIKVHKGHVDKHKYRCEERETTSPQHFDHVSFPESNEGVTSDRDTGECGNKIRIHGARAPHPSEAAAV